MVVDEINIEKILPQSAPFIMIDRVVAYEKGQSLTAIKNLSMNDWFFENAHQDCDFFPETLMIEAAAQTAIVFASLNNGLIASAGSLIVLGKIKAEFFNQAVIGNQVMLSTSSHKVLKDSGFIDIDVDCENINLAKSNILYSVQQRASA